MSAVLQHLFILTVLSPLLWSKYAILYDELTAMGEKKNVLLLVSLL